jgi:hypothetical protein
VDGGSSIDMFHSSLSALKLTQAYLKPYDAQFWGVLPGQSCFISRLGKKVLPFFKLLKASEKFVWSEDNSIWMYRQFNLELVWISMHLKLKKKKNIIKQ